MLCVGSSKHIAFVLLHGDSSTVGLMSVQCCILFFLVVDSSFLNYVDMSVLLLKLRLKS